MIDETERSLGLLEIETSLIDALRAAEDGDADAVAVVDAWLDGALEKRDAYAAVHYRLKSEIEHCKEYIAKVEAIKATTEKALDRLHDRAMYVMRSTGQKQIKGHIHTLTIRPTPGKVVIEDEDAIPDMYCKVKRVPDKTAIKRAIEQSVKVPGADLTMPGETLVIK